MSDSISDNNKENTGAEIMAAMTHFIGSGGTLKMLQDVSDDTMESMYGAAYNLYQVGKYEEGIKLFQGLCMLDHYKAKYFMGLGACRQMLKQYTEALEAFSYALVLNVDDPRPQFHGGECHLMLGDLDKAKLGFQNTIELTGNREEFQEIKEKAQQMLEHIKIREQESNS